MLGTLFKVTSDITLCPPYTAAFFFVVFTVASRVYLSTFSSTGNVSSVTACCVRFTSVLQRPGTQCVLQKYVMSEWTNMGSLHFTDHSFRGPEFYLRRNKQNFLWKENVYVYRHSAIVSSFISWHEKIIIISVYNNLQSVCCMPSTLSSLSLILTIILWN